MDQDNLDDLDTADIEVAIEGEEPGQNDIEVVQGNDAQEEQKFNTFDIDEQEQNLAKNQEEKDLFQQEPEESNEAPVEDEEAPKAKKKKHSTLKAEFNRVQRERYAALNEVEKLRKENERLQHVATQNANAALSRHTEAIELRLAQAKQAKATAYESADTAGILKADEDLAEAMVMKKEAERWSNDQKYMAQQREQYAKQQQEEQEQEQYHEPVEVNEEAESWLTKNQWFDAKSPEHNPQLSQIAQSYSLALEQEYLATGQEDKIFTQQYFDDIDRYLNERYYDLDEEPAKPVKQAAPAVQPRMNINMKQVRQNVAPVGKTVKQAAAPSPNRVVLSAREIEFAKKMNLKPEEYARQKLKIAKSGRYGYEQNGR